MTTTTTRSCPHGDPYCPCQDGDTCHYEGPDPMPCPLLLVDVPGPEGYEARKSPHCHVEGCLWSGEHSEEPIARLGNCHLLRTNPRMSADGAYVAGCGAIRRMVETPRHPAPS